MSVVREYALTSEPVQYIKMPAGSSPVSVRLVNGELFLAVFCPDEMAVGSDRRFIVVPTGQSLPPLATPHRFVGTALGDGLTDRHVFEAA